MAQASLGLTFPLLSSQRRIKQTSFYQALISVKADRTAKRNNRTIVRRHLFMGTANRAGFLYQEYKDTLHYSNRTGVRAICPDCHMPREWQYR